jgi:hypothetical protein
MLRESLHKALSIEEFDHMNLLLKEVETELISLRKENMRYYWEHGPLKDCCVPEMIEFDRTDKTPSGAVLEEIHDYAY